MSGCSEAEPAVSTVSQCNLGARRRFFPNVKQMMVVGAAGEDDITFGHVKQA